MSFYGSVYYQVINNFYKAIANNTGKNKKVFLNSDNFANNAAFEAIGRKGTLDFDTGNKWINLEKGSNQALNIYHAPASVSSNNKTIVGFKKIEESEDQPNERDIIKLEPGDLIRTNIANYDEAGHVASTIEQVYEMPLGESERITALEKVVGNVIDGETVDIDDLVLPEVDDENKENLLGYVEDNTKNVNTLNSYVGNWVNTMDGWTNRGYSTDFKPTISDIMGDLDNLFKGGKNSTPSNYKSEWNKRNDIKPTIAYLIGNLPEMWAQCEIESSDRASLADSISTIYTKLYDLWNTDHGTLGQMSGLTQRLDADLGDRGALGPAFTRINNLDSNLSEEISRATAAEAQALKDAKDYTDKVKKDLLGEGITDTFDTLVEIQDWINGDGVNATELTEAIAIESKSREDADKQEVNDRNTAISEAIATEVSERNTAIGDAIAIEVSNRNTAISEAIATEIIARNTAIADAVGAEATARDTDIGDAIAIEVSNRNTAISEAIATEISERNTAIGNAKAGAIVDANEYTDQKIKDLLDKIAKLEERLSVLEPDPDPETPEGGAETPEGGAETPEGGAETPEGGAETE